MGVVEPDSAGELQWDCQRRVAGRLVDDVRHRLFDLHRTRGLKGKALRVKVVLYPELRA